MYILGISAFYHDSAASIIRNGEIIAAVQEERFTRIKNDASFPVYSIKYCLKQADITISDIKDVVFYENPNLKLKRIINNHINNVFKSFFLYLETFPEWLLYRYKIKQIIQRNLGQKYTGRIHYGQHHRSHLASSYYPSPFNEALLISIDGVGESNTTVIASGTNNSIQFLKYQSFPHSVGLLYSAFTSYCGFKINSGEYKLMGLAPYGKPIYKELIETKMLTISSDGLIELNLSYFPFCHKSRMYNQQKWEQLLEFSPRESESKITQNHANLASSIQEVIKSIIYKVIKYGLSLFPSKNLCLSGGVALNCVINGHIAKDFNFDRIWIQPAAGDAGGSLGAALDFYYKIQPLAQRIDGKGDDAMKHTYLGPEYSNKVIAKVLKEHHLQFEELNENELTDKTAHLLSKGQIIGWFQGRMEFGPRALGNRSILGDPKNISLQKEMNLKIKFRESFRPFAPSVLEEYTNQFFDFNGTSEYMQFVANVKKELLLDGISNACIDPLLIEPRSLIPSVTHVDNTARLQTVSETSNPKYAKLLKRFSEISNYLTRSTFLLQPS